MYASHYDHRLFFRCTCYNKMPSAYLIKINARYRTQEKYKMHFTSISKVTAVISATKQLAATYPLQYPDHSPGADDLSIINTEKRMSEDPNLRKKGELLDHHHPFAGMSFEA